MKKKIITSLVVGSLLVIAALPLIASAQSLSQGPNDCCVIHQNMTFSAGSVSRGDIVGSTDPNAVCVVNGQQVTPTVTLPPELSWATVCTINTITYAMNWVFYIILIIAVLMIIVGGFEYITAQGDPENAKKGKNYVIYALIGVAIAVFAKVMPAIIKGVMGV